MLRARVTWDMATDLTLSLSPSMFFAIRSKKFLDGFRASSHLTPHGLSLMETCALKDGRLPLWKRRRRLVGKRSGVAGIPLIL